MIRSLDDVTTAAASVAEETLPWQPGLAMVHFRVAGSKASDRVAATLAQIVEAHAGQLPLTEVDVDDRPQLAARYNVRVTPSVLLLRDGSVVDRVIGDASRILVQSLLDARAPRTLVTRRRPQGAASEVRCRRAPGARLAHAAP